MQQSFSVQFSFPVCFTEYLVSPSNPALRAFLEAQQTDTIKKLLIVADNGVMMHHPGLAKEIEAYISTIKGYTLSAIILIPGGENCKNDERHFYTIVDAINEYGIDRHSYLIGIGGGSLLDLAGYAAAVSHRASGIYGSRQQSFRKTIPE